MNAIQNGRGIPAAETETFVVAETADGYRVCSPLTPGKQYLVSGSPEAPTCTCETFAEHASEAGWCCKHIEAVLRQTGGTLPRGGNGASAEPAAEAENRNRGKRAAGSAAGAVMVLKRSVSPDGRIDSLSVEFSCPIGRESAEELKSRAKGMLDLQTEIAEGFRKEHSNGNGNGHAKGNGNGGNGTVPGQLIAVAGMNGKWGRRLFITVLVNGQVLKLFGSQKELADAVSAVGFPGAAAELAEGQTLNLPCRVATKPSPDGKYLNVERVLPATPGAK